jgi:hypothetical protein
MLHGLSRRRYKQFSLVDDVPVAHQIGLWRAFLRSNLPCAPSLIDGRVNNNRPSKCNGLLMSLGVRADGITMMQDGVPESGKQSSERATLLARHATSRTAETDVHH